MKLDFSMLGRQRISEMVKELPKIGDNTYTWTYQSLAKILRNHHDTLEQLKYFSKNDDMFLELLYLLNEGYITSRVEEYNFGTADTYSDYLNLLEEMQPDIADELTKNFHYMNEVMMNYTLWEKLNEAGAEDIDINKRNYTVYAKDTGVMCKTGNVSIKHLLSSFEKGIEQFIIVPFTVEETGLVYIFSTTAKYKEELKNKAIEKKNLKKVFSKVKGTYNPNFPIYYGEDLNTRGMVEVEVNSKKIRGFIDEIIHDSSDYDAYLEKNSIELRTHTIEEMLGLSKRNANINFYFTREEFYAADYTIKVLRKTKTSESHDFYAISKENILTSWTFHNRGLQFVIRNMFILGERSNPEIQYNINTKPTNDTANAYYLSPGHIITINFNTITSSSFEQFALHGFNSNDFIANVIAHELGHADLRGNDKLGESYLVRVEKINALSKKIAKEIEIIEISGNKDKEQVKELLEECSELVELLKAHYEVVMASEMDAFVYGMDYILDDNLKLLFQKNNYDSYTQYLDGELKPVRKAQNQMYEIQRLYELITA